MAHLCFRYRRGEGACYAALIISGEVKVTGPKCCAAVKSGVLTFVGQDLSGLCNMFVNMFTVTCLSNLII